MIQQKSNNNSNNFTIKFSISITIRRILNKNGKQRRKKAPQQKLKQNTKKKGKEKIKIDETAVIHSTLLLFIPCHSFSSIFQIIQTYAHVIFIKYPQSKFDVNKIHLFLFYRLSAIWMNENCEINLIYPFICLFYGIK